MNVFPVCRIRVLSELVALPPRRGKVVGGGEEGQKEGRKRVCFLICERVGGGHVRGWMVDLV